VQDAANAYKKLYRKALIGAGAKDERGLKNMAYAKVKNLPLDELEAIIAAGARKSDTRSKHPTNNRFMSAPAPAAEEEGPPAAAVAADDAAPPAVAGEPKPVRKEASRWRKFNKPYLMSRSRDKKKRQMRFQQVWSDLAAHNSLENRCTLLIDSLSVEERECLLTQLHMRVVHDDPAKRSTSVAAQWHVATAWGRVGPAFVSQLSEYPRRIRLVPMTILSQTLRKEGWTSRAGVKTDLAFKPAAKPWELSEDTSAKV
jgi:hypothetical protein